MRILIVIFASLLMFSVIGCGEESEEIFASEVAPETSENDRLATGVNDVPAAPALSKIEPAQHLSWHALPQSKRNQKILDRAYKDEDKYVGDEKNNLTGQCKAWVQDVVYSASDGAVYPPKTDMDFKDRWYESKYCIGRCAPITSARPGEIVQVRWKESYVKPPENLHTFIVVSVNASTITVIDSNAKNNKTVYERELKTSEFNENADSFSIYYIW